MASKITPEQYHEARQATTAILSPSLQSQGRRAIGRGPRAQATARAPRSQKAQCRKKKPARRVRRRCKAVVDQAFQPSSLTYLEQNAVAPSTTRQYSEELRSLEAPTPPENLDFLEYQNEMYVEGHQSYKADRLIAAVLHNHAEYGRMGNRKLPRTWRAIATGSGDSHRAGADRPSRCRFGRPLRFR